MIRIQKRKETVLAPLYMRIAIVLRALLPSLYFYLMKRRAVKEKKNQ